MTDNRQVWREPFLRALGNVPVVREAARAAGVTRSTAYKARKADPEFARAWDEALENGIDCAELEAFRRAVVGYEEPVVFQGRLTYIEARDPTAPGGVLLDDNGKPVLVALTIRRYSDRLLEVILKGRRKSVYSDRTELVSPDGSLSPVVDDTSRAARIGQLIKLAQNRKDDEDQHGDLA